MDQEVRREKPPATFNGPLEAGIRAVAILGEAYPQSFDLQKLVAFDHLLVHTGDIGGPDSLHPSAPLQSAELLVRRKLVEQGLLLMMTRELVQREVSADGIKYCAGENAVPFLSALESVYLKALKQRARWLVETFADRSDQELRHTIRQFFDHWVEEFQTAERSWGSE